MKPKKTRTIESFLSRQSLAALEKLATRGIMGQTPEEVAARFIDKELQTWVFFERVQIHTAKEHTRQYPRTVPDKKKKAEKAFYLEEKKR